MKHMLGFGLLLWAVVVTANNFEAGVKAYDHFDYQRAYEIWLPLAKQGDSKAQYNLGVMFEEGNGLPADTKRAFVWYQQSAKSGYVPAQYRMGNAYYFGKGVAQDYDQAIAYWKQAAKKKHSSAQYNLGVLFLYSGSRYRDVVEASKWLKMAAKQKHEAAGQLLKQMDIATEASKPIAVKKHKKQPPTLVKAPDKKIVAKKAQPVVIEKRVTVKTSPVAKAQPSTKPIKTTGTDWIGLQPIVNYTVQLTVRSTMAQAQAFIKKHKLQGKAYAYQLRGSAVVKVIYGSYDKRAKASQAIRGLAKSLRKDGPWTKKFALVRSERGQ